jgi:hypothetical protein
MLITRGIAMSDGLNRKNHYFSLESILKAYADSWNQGTPSNLNHDNTRFIGWNYVTGIYIEPGKAYVTNSMTIPETEEEHTNLFEKNLNYLYKVYYLDRKEKYDILKDQLGDKLSKNANPALINCVAYEDEGIVPRVFPEIKHMLHKGLIDIRLLEPILPGIYKKDNYILFAHRFLRRNCSILNSLNDSFLERLQNLRGSDLSVQIALDLDLIGLWGTEQMELEYQYWWGPKFNDDLSTIPNGVTRHNNEHYDNIFTNLCFTEFGWYVQDGLQTFECEEVNDRPNIILNNKEYYGCRFVHSMLNPKTNLPNHLDGAVRAYTDEKMLNRMDINIDKAERDTLYTKLWRIDNDMPVSLWKELITHYYRDNILIGEYFSGRDEKLSKIVLEDNTKDEVTSLEKYIPVNMNTNDGIRFYFYIIPCIDINEKYDIDVKSNELMLCYDRKTRVMESETITVLKLLKKYGANVRFPATARIAHEDTVFNFPTFICRNEDNAKKVQNAFVELCKVWSDNNDDRLISYSIVCNYDKEAVHFSFAGHVNDFKIIFEKIGTTFPHKDAINNWVETLYNENNKFPVAALYPKTSDILTEAGCLKFRRSLVPQKYLQDIKMEDKYLTVSFVEKKEIFEELAKHKIGISPIYHIKETKCMRCQKEYILCNCIKFIDDVSEKIQRFEFLGATWTNRHA